MTAAEQASMVYQQKVIAERDRLRQALERLASMEAFEGARTVHDIIDAELMARIQFARTALGR
jgi:nitrogen-specific signal transduction histidine kinase